MQKLKDADLDLVELKDGTPHCKKHGAMNKLTKDGIWRCVTTYKVQDDGKIDENNCRAGCQISKRRLIKFKTPSGLVQFYVDGD